MRPRVGGRPHLRLRLVPIWFLLALTVGCGQAAPSPTPSGNGAEGPAVSPPPAGAATPSAGAQPAGTAEAPTATPTLLAGVGSPTAIPGGDTAPVRGEGLSEPPARDLVDLARRLRPGTAVTITRTAATVPPTLEAGHSDSFFITDLLSSSVHTIQATLLYVSDHAYWYADDSLAISHESLEDAAAAFERRIYPAVTGAFGDVRDPGVGGDPRITILHTPLSGVSGYFGAQDEYPRGTHPYSNVRSIIYMNGAHLEPGSATYAGVLAHEFQHAVHWNSDGDEDAWVNEGLSELAKDMAGYGASFTQFFLRDSTTQLNYFPEDTSQSPPYYGAASLFMIYLSHHYGGEDGLRSLVREPLDGILGVESYLSARGRSIVEVFTEWVIANLLGDPEGPYGYGDRRFRVADIGLLTRFGERAESVPQFAARYLDLRLPEGDAAVEFVGATTTGQFSGRCHSGRYCWWGNRGDSIDTTLTQEFDLTGVEEATLEFWTWYAVEEGWDYAYVEVSTDDGLTWTVLEGENTTTTDPVGNSYGPGFTGRSDGWVQEEMDLTAFAGRKLALRFEYVTDDAVYLDGFAIDDVAIPELGFLDDAEVDAGWRSEGFQLTDNTLPQRFAVQVIEWRTDGGRLVRSLEMGAEMTGRTLLRGFGEELDHATFVIAPVTGGTHQPAGYTLTVRPADAE